MGGFLLLVGRELLVGFGASSRQAVAHNLQVSASSMSVAVDREQLFVYYTFDKQQGGL